VIRERLEQIRREVSGTGGQVVASFDPILVN
jgi:hypothetical protein